MSVRRVRPQIRSAAAWAGGGRLALGALAQRPISPLSVPLLPAALTRSSMTMRPAGLPPMVMSKKTLGLDIFDGCGVGEWAAQRTEKGKGKAVARFETNEKRARK